jgi:hypothetical protein
LLPPPERLDPIAPTRLAPIQVLARTETALNSYNRFSAGRRRKTTPYERLGISWPPDLPWWELLKLTPEQLTDKLSKTNVAV